MAMRTMTSSVGSNPARLTSQIGAVKTMQDNATTLMGSDTVGAIGTADPDFNGFTTGPFRTMKPVTVRSGAGIYSTIAMLPDQQHATLEDRYYDPGTLFVMDRAGSGNVGFNILRNGPPPAGYYGGNKRMVQRRTKRYFRKDPGDGSFCFIYDCEVASQPGDYTLGEDERLDGDFFPGSIYLGVNRPFGWTFPTDPNNGRMLYNSDPFTDAGWSGGLTTVPDNPATKPTITAISPTSYALGSDSGTLTITGTNFTDCGFALVGPFQPVRSVGTHRAPLDIPTGVIGQTLKIVVQPDGAYYYRAVVSDTSITLAIPGPDWVAGIYNIIVIGNDGQMAVDANAFTITGA